MNVGYLVGHFPSISETFILREMIALRKLGFNVTVFSIEYRRPGIRHPETNQFAASTCYLRPGPADWWHAIRANIPGGFPVRAAAIVLARELRQRGINHIHAHFAYTPAEVARAAAGLCGCSYSVSAHAWDIFSRSGSSLAGCLEPARFVSVCTRAGFDRLAAFFPAWQPDKLVHIPHGVFAEDFQPAEEPGAIVLGVGRLAAKKGFVHLIRACQELKRLGNPVECVIAGDGPEWHNLFAERQNLNLQDSVHMAGALTQPDIRALYRRAAVLVVPSVVTTSGDMDGIPNVILEAMAMRVPVIATNTGGIAEVVRDGWNGILVPAGNAEALAASIRKLLNDPAERSRLGSNGRADVVERFDADRNVAPLARLLEAAIRR